MSSRKPAFGFWGRSISALPSPMIKEVIIEPNQEYSPRSTKRRLLALTATILIPITDKTLAEPLNLFLDCIKDEPSYRQYKGAYSARYTQTKILQKKNTAFRKSISINGKLQKYYSAINPVTGDKYYVNELNVKLKVPYNGGIDGSLKNLYLIAATYSYNELPRQADMLSLYNSRENDGSNFTISDTVILPILKNFRVPPLARYLTLATDIPFYGKRGTIWPGPAAVRRNKRLPGSPRAYILPPSSPDNLMESAECANYKVKDLRFLGVDDSGVSSRWGLQPPHLLPLFPDKRSPVLNGTFADRARAHMLKEDDKYLTIPQFSRRRSGNIPIGPAVGSLSGVDILVGFEYRNFIKNNTEFGFLFDEGKDLAQIAQFTGLKLYRTTSDQEILLNDLTPQWKCGSGTSVTSFGLSPTAVASIVGDNGTRVDLMLHDGLLPNQARLPYQYYLKIEMIDHSRGALEVIIGTLKSRLRRFNKYVAHFTGEYAPGLQPYKLLRSRETQIKNNASYKELINSLVVADKIIKGSLRPPRDNASSRTSDRDVQRILLSMACQYSATISSIFRVRDIALDYISSLQRLLTTQYRDAETLLSPPTSVQNAPESRHMVNKLLKLNKLYHHEPTFIGGAVYLGITMQSTQLSAVPTVSYDTFESLVRRQKNIYTTPGVNTLITLAPYGFLPPAIVETGAGEQIPVKMEMDLNSGLDMWFANKQVDSPFRRFLGPATSEPARSSMRATLLGMEGVTVKSKRVSLQELANESPDTILEAIDSSLYFFTGSNFVINDEPQVNISGSNDPITQGAFNKQENVLNSEMTTYMLEASLRDYKGLTLEGTGSIIGSFAYNQLLYDNGFQKFEDLNMFEKDMNFNALAKVEYKTTRSDIEEWQQMTKTLFNQLKNSKTGVLCRLHLATARPAFNVNNKFELPLYDTLFLLGGPPEISGLFRVAPADLEQASPQDSYTPPSHPPARFKSYFDKMVESFGAGAYNYPMLEGAVYSEYLTFDDSDLHISETP